MKEGENRKGWGTINIYPSTKERFRTKFKKYNENDDKALTRLMDLAGVSK